MKLWLVMLAVSATVALGERPAHQFLLLVDGSLSMASRQATAARKVRELVRSGFQNQAMAGDRFDLWTFTSVLKSNVFAGQEWNGTNSLIHAEMAGSSIEGSKFLGRTRFQNFAGELTGWMAQQTNALVVMLTDGEDPVMDLPNDIEINSYISSRRGQARTARRVFMVAYSVIDGRIGEWMAHDGLGPMQLPRLPVRPAVQPAAIAEVPAAVREPEIQPEPPPPPVIDLPPGSKVVTPSPSPADELAPAIVTTTPVLSEPRKEPAPVPQDQDPAEQDPATKPAEPAPIAAIPAEPTVAATPVAEISERASPPAIAEVAPEKTNASPAVTEPLRAEAAPPAPDSNSGAPVVPEEAKAAWESPKVEAVREIEAAVTAKTNELSAAEAAATLATTAAGKNRNLYFVLGGGLGVLIIALLILRRPAPEKASLISRSLSQK